MAVAAAMAGAGALTNVLSSIFGAREQTKQLKRGMQTIRGANDEAQGAILPWREAGANALKLQEQMLLQGPGDITEDAGYQFEIEEGGKLLQRRAGAKGQLGTGAFAKRISEYGQGLASRRYGEFFNRYLARTRSLGELSRTGYGAASQSAGMSTREGEVLADYQTGIGRARASGYAGIAKSMQGGLRDFRTSQLAGGMEDQFVLGRGMGRGIMKPSSVGNTKMR